MLDGLGLKVKQAFLMAQCEKTCPMPRLPGVWEYRVVAWITIWRAPWRIAACSCRERHANASGHNAERARNCAPSTEPPPGMRG